MGASGPSATLAVTPHSVPTENAARQCHISLHTLHYVSEQMHSACALASHGHIEEPVSFSACMIMPAWRHTKIKLA